MFTARPHYRSFAGGEITPELFGRIDLAKFQTGLALARNFRILPHGPAQNRHGLAYVNETKDSSKRSVLLPFSYNTEQTFVLELGEGYVRWHTNGGTLLEAGKAITQISQQTTGVATVPGHGFIAGQWVFLNGILGMTNLNGRFVRVGSPSSDHFVLEDLSGAPIDTTNYPAYESGGTAARIYEIATPYVEADLQTLHFAQSEDVLSITHRNYKPRELRRIGATDWQLVEVSFVPTLPAPAAPGVSTSGSGSTSYSYKTTALADGTLEESLPSNSTTVTNDLTTSGNRNTITPAGVTGAVRYNIYKLFNGLYGYIGQTDGSAFVDNNVTPDVSKTPAVHSDPFATATNYPSGVGYYESRRVFAGTIVRPQNYWLTRSATESNLSYSIPTRDDDTIQGRVKAGEVNSIWHVIATNEALVLLTSGGPWKLQPINSDILTPATAMPKQISGEGASAIQPAKTSDEIVYIGDAGNRLFAIKYRWEADGLVTEDLSLLAPHLFDEFTITSITYSRGPKTLWMTRNDGVLIGNTYLPRHEVNAFHRHDTFNGEFESVCSVKEGLDYPLYAIVKRNINGRTVRYIERMTSLRAKAQEDHFFVDCGTTYDGEAADTVYGLWHLIGQEVIVVGDGGEQPPQIVSAEGTVTLDAPASVIHVGLPIEADIQTLPLILESAPAGGQSHDKSPTEVWLRVHETSGLFVGPTFDNLREVPARSNENYDTPPRLKNGIVSIRLDSDWDSDSRVCVRQKAALPCTISSMSVLVSASG